MKLIIILCIFPIIVAKEHKEKRSLLSTNLQDLKWVLLRKNACFSGASDLPAIVPIWQDGFLVATKLVHVSGIIKCSGSAQGSNFGCYDDHTKLNVFVCDDKRQVIFPSPSQVITYDYYKNYQYPGFMATDKEIIFSNFPYPVFVNNGEQITIWNGEDLFNVADTDNSGRVCVDVYGLIGSS
ncbi:uncharacterized protein LOC100215883 [Hydra vulgaris]|uniref:uncharacterized protein LOC100215883 n=1 Tax=Hydra vulgaris TaxID=6087 RepID=UPI00019274BF|nr:uncharacterized protein LOC100215883 [Hydra vulgaris]